MAYQHDPDGPVVDKGGFRARIIEACGVIALSCIIIFIVTKVLRPESKRMEEALDLTKLELKHSPYNYSVDSSEDVITVSLWESGLTITAKKASEGDPEAVAEWNKTKDSVLQYAYSIESNLYIEDITDIPIIVQVVNESNHSRTLLVYKNSKLVYDVTEGG